jgi:hypothetical protein
VSLGSLRALCFATLGALTARHVSPEPSMVLPGTLAAVLVGAIAMGVLRLLLSVTNPAVRAEQGMAGIRDAVARGFTTLVPFTALAAVAELHFGWQVVQAFAAAGLAASAGATGMELARIGGGRVRNAILPTLWAIALAVVWMILATLAPRLGGMT